MILDKDYITYAIKTRDQFCVFLDKAEGWMGEKVYELEHVSDILDLAQHMIAKKANKGFEDWYDLYEKCNRKTFFPKGRGYLPDLMMFEIVDASRPLEDRVTKLDSLFAEFLCVFIKESEDAK